MVLQMEDCVDVMKVLHPEVDVLLLFDHSCGSDRQQENGLNVENMSKGCDETFDPLLDQGLVEVWGHCCYLLLLLKR
jgi:hypothetical protein